MGRSPSRSEDAELNRGSWTAQEDHLLSSYVMAQGEGKWTHVPKRAGLNRSGKSCRLRWLNYLRPDIKRGNITQDEQELIIKLHKLLGNRWSLIAGRLPGRTDNEIKNYWNTTLAKKLKQSCSMCEQHPSDKSTPTQSEVCGSQVIKTKATRCKNVVILDPPYPMEKEEYSLASNQMEFDEAGQTPQFSDQSQLGSQSHSTQHHMNSDVKMLMITALEENAADFNPESSMGMMMDDDAERCPLIEELMVNWWSTEDEATVDLQHSGHPLPTLPLCHMFD